MVDIIHYYVKHVILVCVINENFPYKKETFFLYETMSLWSFLFQTEFWNKNSAPFFPKHGGLGGLQEAVLFMTTKGDRSDHHHLSSSPSLLTLTSTITFITHSHRHSHLSHLTSHPHRHSHLSPSPSLSSLTSHLSPSSQIVILNIGTR